MTFYDGGGALGSCGEPIIDTELAIALPVGFMGAASNNNKYCGKTVNIKYNGITQTATVKDKCGGCQGHSIDMTRGLFEKL